jgi:hypothetical protein
VEEHERGPALKLNPGPPFAVGDVIIVDVPGHPPGRQQAFVMNADHPRYRIRLEKGGTVWTSMGKAWLQPRIAPGQLAPKSDNPLVDLQAGTKLKLGSYGVHIDAQLESVEKVDEAKAYAKAVKADDMEVPLHLWNKRIRSPGVTREKRDAALTAFRKLGHRWFLHGLTCNCSVHMRRTHRKNWPTQPRSRPDEELAKVGKDQHAIAGILWHATHTNWFKFHAGLHLVHLRFSIRYREMARDGVPVFFERPGPTSREFQPPMADEKTQAMAKDKILKVISEDTS